MKWSDDQSAVAFCDGDRRYAVEAMRLRAGQARVDLSIDPGELIFLQNCSRTENKFRNGALSKEGDWLPGPEKTQALVLKARSSRMKRLRA
jgi:hypothetical protein